MEHISHSNCARQLLCFASLLPTANGGWVNQRKGKRSKKALPFLKPRNGLHSPEQGCLIYTMDARVQRFQQESVSLLPGCSETGM
jgi:hypothetical protein